MFGLGKNKKKKKKKGEEEVKGQDVENEEAEEENEEGGDDDAEEGDGEGEGKAKAKGGKEAAPKKSKKKLIMAVVAVLVLAGVGAGVYFSGILGDGKKKESEATMIGPDGKPMEKPIFYTLPDFLVNLNASGKQASYLKAIVILELAHQTDVPLVEVNLPRISDAFTTYLRELRPSDLAGSAGIQRLREELLLRVNRALAPVKVNDILFKEIVVQ